MYIGWWSCSVLGPEKFGLIAFAQSFIQYFNILTDYGFNLSALVFTKPKFRNDWLVYFFTFGMVLGNVLWFF